MFARDSPDHIAINIVRNKHLQWGCIHDRVAARNAGKHLRARDIVGRIKGINIAQLFVISGAEEGKRRDQGAGADTADDFECWALATGCPTIQETSPERSVCPATGESEVRKRTPARQDFRAMLSDLSEAGRKQLIGVLSRRVTPGAHVANALKLRLANERCRHSCTWDRRAARQDDSRQDNPGAAARGSRRETLGRGASTQSDR